MLSFKLVQTGQGLLLNDEVLAKSGAVKDVEPARHAPDLNRSLRECTGLSQHELPGALM